MEEIDAEINVLNMENNHGQEMSLNLIDQAVHMNLIHSRDKDMAKALSGGRKKGRILVTSRQEE